MIGGSITLIGQPTAAAVPVTPALQDRYIAWLANEHAAALYERDPPHLMGDNDLMMRSDWHDARVRQPLFWFPQAPDIERMTAWSKPSTRAAVVLSAAGVGLV